MQSLLYTQALLPSSGEHAEGVIVSNEQRLSGLTARRLQRRARRQNTQGVRGSDIETVPHINIQNALSFDDDGTEFRVLYGGYGGAGGTTTTIAPDTGNQGGELLAGTCLWEKTTTETCPEGWEQSSGHSRRISSHEINNYAVDHYDESVYGPREAKYERELYVTGTTTATTGTATTTGSTTGGTTGGTQDNHNQVKFSFYKMNDNVPNKQLPAVTNTTDWEGTATTTTTVPTTTIMPVFIDTSCLLGHAHN